MTSHQCVVNATIAAVVELATREDTNDARKLTTRLFLDWSTVLLAYRVEFSGLALSQMVEGPNFGSRLG